MWEKIRVVFTIPELRQKIFLTLFLLAVPISCIHQFYFVYTAEFLSNYGRETASEINKIFGVGGGVDDLCQVGAGESGRTARDQARTNVFAERYFAHVYLEYGLAPTDIWQRYNHLPIKSSWPQQGRIEHIGSVCRGNDNDTFTTFKSIHLDQ